MPNDKRKMKIAKQHVTGIAETVPPKAGNDETVTRVIVALLFRLGVGTAVFEPFEMNLPEKYSLRCRRQADGSVAVILEPAK